MSRVPQPGGDEVGSGLPSGDPALEDDDLLGSLHSEAPFDAPGDGGNELYGDLAGIETEALLETETVTEFKDDPNLNPFALSSKELMFCYAYARAGNGAQAARYAGYSGGGSQATKLLLRDDIQAEVRRQRGFINETQPAVVQPATPDEVLERFWEVANASPADLFVKGEDDKYRYIALADMPPSLRRAIKRIRVKDGEILDIELHDSMVAAGKLAGYLGLAIGHRGIGAWGDTGGGATGEEGEEQQLPAVPQRPTTTLTFEQTVAADGARISRKILQQS